MMPAAYQEFLRKIPEDGRLRLVQLYHAVRNIPYGAAGVRDPVKVIENNAGSCSGKHLLLRDLLWAENYETEVITIYTHFNKEVPLHESYPDELARMIREEIVYDFHHYVRARIDGSWLRLDATCTIRLLPTDPGAHRFGSIADAQTQIDRLSASLPKRSFVNQRK